MKKIVHPQITISCSVLDTRDGFTRVSISDTTLQVGEETGTVVLQ